MTDRAKTRSAARLAAVQALYQMEMEGTPLAQLLHEFHQHRLGATIEDVTYHPAEEPFFDDVVTGVAARRTEIDALIADKLASGWTLERLDKPMRQILRAGSYELLARADVPTGSVISEYVDVAHAFYDKREAGFVNGLLDAIARGRPGVLMSGEADFLRRLRAMARDPAARGLMDDAALLQTSGEQLVLTADTMVEGVHYRADDPPDTVGWKLAAVNLSDLAAKGAVPRACLLSYTLSGDADWDAAFLDGLARALDIHAMPLIGGDTVALPAGAPRVLGLTAIGAVPAGQPVPDRAGARPGDILYLSGPVGDAGAGLELLHTGVQQASALVAAYRTPQPHLALGRMLAPRAHAMMDISDGLLIDAHRMALASGCAIRIDAVPLSADFAARHGLSVESRLAAATAGDDYVLLAALPPGLPPPEDMIAIGVCAEGAGLSLVLDGRAVPLPDRLGYEHRPA